MIKSSSIWHLSSNAISVILPLFTIPILISRLGLDGYGQIALIQLISAATLPLIDGGMSQLSHVFIRRQLSKVNPFYQAVHLFWFFLTLIPLLIYSVLFDKTLLFPFLLSQLCCVLTFSPSPYFLSLSGRQRDFGLSQLAIKVLHAIFLIAFVFKKDDIVLVFVSQLFITIFVNIAVFRSCAIPRVHFHAWIFKAFIVVGFRKNLRRLSSTPLTYIMPLLISQKASLDSVAIFSIMEKIRGVVWQLIYPLIFRKSPSIAKLFAEREYSKMAEMFRALQRQVLLVALLLVFLIISSNFLVNFIGISSEKLKYHISFSSLAVYCIALVVYALQSLYLSIYGALLNVLFKDVFTLCVCAFVFAIIAGFASSHFSVGYLYISNIGYDLLSLYIIWKLKKSHESNSYKYTAK